MELSTENKIAHKEADADELVAAFVDDRGRGEFIILSQSDHVYIQASGDDDGPYVLEYREGDEANHFQCPDDLSKAQIQAAFVKYLQADESWKSDFSWEALDLGSDKPWWKFW